MVYTSTLPPLFLHQVIALTLWTSLAAVACVKYSLLIGPYGLQTPLKVQQNHYLHRFYCHWV